MTADQALRAAIARVRGRLEMNSGTAERHPDANVRAAAATRVTAYALVIEDLERLRSDVFGSGEGARRVEGMLLDRMCSDDAQASLPENSTEGGASCAEPRESAGSVRSDGVRTDNNLAST